MKKSFGKSLFAHIHIWISNENARTNIFRTRTEMSCYYFLICEFSRGYYVIQVSAYKKYKLNDNVPRNEQTFNWIKSTVSCKCHNLNGINHRSTWLVKSSSKRKQLCVIACAWRLNIQEVRLSQPWIHNVLHSETMFQKQQTHQ